MLVYATPQARNRAPASTSVAPGPEILAGPRFALQIVTDLHTTLRGRGISVHFHSDLWPYRKPRIAG